MSDRVGRHVMTFAGLVAIAVAAFLIARPVAQTREIVLYAADVSVVSGNWTRLTSTTGAGGFKMTSENRDWSTASPLPAPDDFFEAEFDAEAGVAYRLWLRIRAAGDSKLNDSVWVQFSEAVDTGGAAIWRIGSSSALLVNLEDCEGCGLSSWGWQDNAWWLGQSSIVRFATTGRQRIRIQTREDGADIDQIVLSPATYFQAAPGATRNDTFVVSKNASTAATLARGPNLQQVTDSSAIVVWTTRQAGVGEVRYRTPAGQMVSAGADTRLVSSAQTGVGFDYYQHEVRLFGLSPASQYTYDVFVAGADLTPGSDTFKTAPLTGTGTVRFIAFGDSGVGSAAQVDLSARMLTDTFDIALHTGDLAYEVGSYLSFENFVFSVYRGWLRSRSFFPSIGNHDDATGFAQPYRDVFVLPENGGAGAFPDHAERYYSFDYGPVHFVALDTERAFVDPARRQAQLSWLEADLASTSQPWKVVYFHKSPYSSGSQHGSNLQLRQAFAPIFERHRVQLVVSGHEHIYERTRPLREFEPSGGEVTYVVTGGGGAPLYGSGSGPWTVTSASVHHYVRATTDSCTLRLEAIRIDGVTFDSFELTRCAQAPPPPPPPAPPPPAPGGTSPYGGSPAAIPGAVEFENFDEGGAGVAYLDNTGGNAGGVYRTTDVDIAFADDGGGGYTLGWVGSNEWLKYTVAVAAAGSYDLEFRVASAGPGGTFHIETDRGDVTGAIGIPDTGGWQAWTTIRKSGVFLNAGVQVWRVVMDTRGASGAVGNFNRATVTVSGATGGSAGQPFGGTAVALPGRVESENFDEGGAGVGYHDWTPGNEGGAYRATDVDIAGADDDGGGYTLGWVGAGEWQAYTVTVGAAGTYNLQLRVASAGSGGTFHIEIDRIDRTGAISIPDTGGWQSWITLNRNITLPAGPQVWRVVMDTNGPSGAVGNFNWIRVQ